MSLESCVVYKYFTPSGVKQNSLRQERNIYSVSLPL